MIQTQRPLDELLDGVIGQDLAETWRLNWHRSRCRVDNGEKCGPPCKAMPRSRAASTMLWATGSITPGLSKTVQPLVSPGDVAIDVSPTPQADRAAARRQLLGGLFVKIPLPKGSRVRFASAGAGAAMVRQ